MNFELVITEISPQKWLFKLRQNVSPRLALTKGIDGSYPLIHMFDLYEAKFSWKKEHYGIITTKYIKFRHDIQYLDPVEISHMLIIGKVCVSYH